MRYLGMVFGFMLLAACYTDGPVAPVAPTPPPDFVQIMGERATYAETISCMNVGGQVQRAGMLGYDMCVIPYADGGMVCTDSSQCRGQCRTGDLGAYGKNITGQCQLNNSPFGCYGEVKNGKGMPALCID